MILERGDTVLVTGAAGFIGFHLSDRLLAEGFAVEPALSDGTGAAGAIAYAAGQNPPASKTTSTPAMAFA